MVSYLLCSIDNVVRNIIPRYHPQQIEIPTINLSAVDYCFSAEIGIPFKYRHFELFSGNQSSIDVLIFNNHVLELVTLHCNYETVAE